MSDNILLVLNFLVFLFTASLVGFLYLVWSEARPLQKHTLKKRLLYISAGGNHGLSKLHFYKDKARAEAGFWGWLSLTMPRLASLDRLLLKSGLPITAMALLLMCIALGVLAVGACLYLRVPVHILPPVGIMAALSPLAYLKAKERAYMEKFKEQLPEALDLLSRAMRSGHALSSGLTMIAEESGEPIKSEFAAVVDQLKLGLSLQEALDNLCERLPDTDLRFFAISVVLQKETGGNLTEVLDNIGRLIRERIQFKRHVQTLTAEGKLSARILTLLPVAMFAYIYFVNYDYISLLWTAKEGYIMLTGGILLQVIGAVIINKIVKIEV